jgi:MFS family permease
MMGPARPAAHVNDVTVLVATLGAAYVASMFLRNSIGVIAPNLADDLALTGPEIALVSSIFFFAFVAAQIPLGIAIDRYGPKRCMLVCAVVTVLSTLLFAGATGFVEMIVARVLMGLGTSCFLMAPLALYARTFPPDRFSVLAACSSESARREGCSRPRRSPMRRRRSAGAQVSPTWRRPWRGSACSSPG